MASLNTLRTKFGYVLSAVIALALLAFIFSLKSEMGFSGNDPKVGEINSEDVLYSEYLTAYEKVKGLSGMTESTEAQATALANATWQSLIANKLLIPGFEQLGLAMSDQERMAVINGEIPTQSFGSAFTDPSTGYYNAAAVADFLSQASTNPQIDVVWSQLNEQAREERAVVKYNALVKSGVYVNSLEVAAGVDAANSSYSGRWVSKPYSSMPDSLFTVSAAEIKKYYQDHKASYKKFPTRTINYVLFGFNATPEDIVNVEKEAMSAGNEFAVATDISDYVRSNYNASMAQNYLPASSFSQDEVDAFSKGQMYGPVKKNNVWTMSRVVSTVDAPDSLGVRHIVLSYQQADLADSLYTAIKGGADFAEAAQAHSLYAQTAQVGGDVGVVPFSSFSGEFIPALESAKKGDIVKIEYSDMIQIMEVYRADSPSKKYQVATVEYPVEASQATIGALHSQAGLFSMEAKGSVDKFKQAADNASLVARTATITNGDRMVRTISDSREVARWAYGAQAGDVSDIFKTSDGYVVAIITDIDDAEYSSMESVTPSIRTTLLREKKYAKAISEMNGASIAAIAGAIDSEVKEFNNVVFNSQYIQGLGVEPSVVGAIAFSDKGVMSAPIEGLGGIYVICVDEVEAVGEQDETMERARAQAVAEDKTVQYIYNALQDMGNIKDLRGKYL